MCYIGFATIVSLLIQNNNRPVCVGIICLSQKDGSSTHEGGARSRSDESSRMIFVIVAVIVVVIVIILVTNQGILSEACGVVTDGIRTRPLQIVKALFGGGGQNIMVTGIVGDSQQSKEILALLGGTIEVASVCNKIGVRPVTTIVLTVGNRTIGSAIDNRSLDSAGGTLFVEVVVTVLDGIGDSRFGTVIVVGLDDVVRTFAILTGTVGGTRVGLQKCQGSKHSVGVGAVNLPSAEFFDLTGARTAGSLGLVHGQSEEQS